MSDGTYASSQHTFGILVVQLPQELLRPHLVVTAVMIYPSAGLPARKMEYGACWSSSYLYNGCLGYPREAVEGSGGFLCNSTDEQLAGGNWQLEEFVSSIDPDTLRSLQAVIGKILAFRAQPPPLAPQQRVKRHRRVHQRAQAPPALGQIQEERPPVAGQVWPGHGAPGPGQQELYPGSGVFLPAMRLATMLQDSRQDCMRLFHQLFEHFFSEDDLAGAVAFGKRGKVPNGKKVLDRRIVDGIITYVLRCSTLDGWTSVDSSKLKKACINKCRMRMSQRRRLGQMTFFNPEHYMMGPSDLQQSTDGF